MLIFRIHEKRLDSPEGSSVKHILFRSRLGGWQINMYLFVMLSVTVVLCGGCTAAGPTKSASTGRAVSGIPDGIASPPRSSAFAIPLPHVAYTVLDQPVADQLAEDGYKQMDRHGVGRIWARVDWPSVSVDTLAPGAAPILGKMWLPQAPLIYGYVAQHGYPAVDAVTAMRYVLMRSDVLTTYTPSIVFCQGFAAVLVSVADSRGEGVIQIALFFPYRVTRGQICTAA